MIKGMICFMSLGQPIFLIILVLVLINYQLGLVTVSS